ncbi:MAG: DoxX family protein [Aureibaculum sp.]
MEPIGYIVIILKLIVSLSILNVWLIQPKKATKWRGGNAKTIIEEFKVYGLSKQLCYFIGFLKVSLALLLLASIQFEALTLIGSLGLAMLLLGSIIMHIKVKDELFKSFPAFLFLVINLAIAFISYSEIE